MDAVIIDSKVGVDVPILNVTGLYAGYSLFSNISMQYKSRVYGMNLVHEYSAKCPIGMHVKYLGIIKASLCLGNANVIAAGMKQLGNGDIKVVQYKRNVDLGVITYLKVGHRGNVYTVGLIRDVERKRWDRFYAEPKNLRDEAPLRHLSDHMNIDLGSKAHQDCLIVLLEQMGLGGVGRSQSDLGRAHDHEKDRKGLGVYRSGRKNDYVHQDFIESANQTASYTKNEDGSETTTFTHTTLGGTDTIRVQHGGERRILMIRYGSRSRSSNKLDDTTVNSHAEYGVALTTKPDGSYEFTVTPSGFSDQKSWEEECGRWRLQFFFRDYKKSDPQAVRQYNESDGKIVNEAILPEKVVQDKFLSGKSYKKGSFSYEWTGLEKLESTVVIDQLTHKWTKHLCEFKIIESFMKFIDNQEYTLSSQLESFHGFTDHLKLVDSFARYSSEGTYSVPLTSPARIELPKVEYHGLLLSQSSTSGTDVIGY